jgi:cytochrome c peroxidase
VDGPSPLPVFRITCGEKKIETHDPGRALITGKCADVGAIVMQQFRGLAARAPYFSNGAAKTLDDVVGFYERRYRMAFTDRQKQDLVDFLKVL